MVTQEKAVLSAREHGVPSLHPPPTPLTPTHRAKAKSASNAKNVKAGKLAIQEQDSGKCGRDKMMLLLLDYIHS